MASAAKEYRYAHREFSTQGNLARDLDWAVRERELNHAGEAPRHEAQAAPKIRREQALVRERQPVPVLTVVEVMAVIAAAVLLLLSYVQLTALSAQTVSLQNELAQLEEENVVLTAQYERMFDLNTIKEAAEAAGMSKPSSSQIYYIDLSEGDSAVVYEEAEPGILGQLLESLHHGVYAVVEYFD